MKQIPLFILVGILFGSLSSCNDHTTTVGTGGGGRTPTVYDSLKYNAFILDTAAIRAANLLNEGGPEADKIKVLVLKLKFDNLVIDTFRCDLLGYPAKDHKHHGDRATAITLARQDTGLVKLPRRLVLGNIYASWRDIIGEIYNTATHTWKTDFGHLKFTPTDRTLGMSIYDGHLHYKITLHKGNGEEIPPVGGAALDETKPSPPAPPYP